MAGPLHRGEYCPKALSIRGPHTGLTKVSSKPDMFKPTQSRILIYVGLPLPSYLKLTLNIPLN